MIELILMFRKQLLLNRKDLNDYKFFLTIEDYKKLEHISGKSQKLFGIKLEIFTTEKGVIDDS